MPARGRGVHRQRVRLAHRVIHEPGGPGRTGGVVLRPQDVEAHAVGLALPQHGGQPVLRLERLAAVRQRALTGQVVGGHDPHRAEALRDVVGGAGRAVGSRRDPHNHPAGPLCGDVGEGRLDHAGNLLRGPGPHGRATGDVDAVGLAAVHVERGEHQDRRRDAAGVDRLLEPLR